MKASRTTPHLERPRTFRGLRLCAWSTLLLVLLLPFDVTSVARADDITIDARLKEAWQDLETLDDLLDDADAQNDAILTYMDLAVKSAQDIRTPALSDAEYRALPVEERRAIRSAQRSLARLRAEVTNLLLEALDETAFDRLGHNRREPVNKQAGPLLGKAASWLEDRDDVRRLVRRIIRKIKRLERARHTVDPAIFEGAFSALARLGEERGLRFLVDEYLHVRKQPEDVARLRASLRSMRKFTKMSARMRHALVDEMLKRYVAIEALAEQSTTDITALAARRFWDAVRLDAIALIQYVAGHPTDDTQRALATMGAFADWFRSHDSPRAAPWSKPLETR